MKKLAYILLAFSMLNVLQSCKTTKEVYVPLADYYSKDFDYLIVHTPNNVFELHDYKFHYRTLEGVCQELGKSKSESYHIYLNTDIESDPSENVIIERKDIQRVTYTAVNEPNVLPVIITFLPVAGLIIFGLVQAILAI
ncbi:hypothetical protein [Maribellus mangrovi]|uniref:hypothetical protein n=1 Tax=Maribellus mangrovi TaxID=3133146 RepID=UPI0030EBD55B